MLCMSYMQFRVIIAVLCNQISYLLDIYIHIYILIYIYYIYIYIDIYIYIYIYIYIT